MTLKASIILVAFAAAFNYHSCPPSPQPPPPDASDAAPPPPTDGGTQTVYNLACAAMALAGCSEGQAPNCSSAMQAGQESKRHDYKPSCVAACRDKACIRGCSKDLECSP